jgi:outer membrane protein insertion porin family
MDNMAPYFNGDEDEAYPDGFDSYDEYISAARVPPNDYRMDYDQWSISFGVATGYRWGTPLGIVGVGGGPRFGWIINTYDNTLFRPFDPVIRKNNNKFIPSNSLWADVYLDSRDIYYDPSDGYYINERFGLYGLIPDRENEYYLQSDTKAEYFWTPIRIPVTEKWTFMTTLGFHSGLTFIFPQPGKEQAILEDTSKLALDGMFNARGWSNEYYNKGLALWENWIELRIPLVPHVLSWDFFFDAAAVQPDWKTFWSGANLAENMRYSYGGGLRFTIPQFPLRFSFAKRFKIIDGKVEWQEGAIGGNGKPISGVDFVFSFAISTY